MPRKIRDLVLAALGAVLLLGALALIDGRVPGRLAGMAREVSAGQWPPPGSFAGNLLTEITSRPFADNFFLYGFLVVGVVLVFLMLRT